MGKISYANGFGSGLIGALGENARRRHIGHDNFQIVAPGGEHLARRFGYQLRRVATVALGTCLLYTSRCV